MQVKIVENKSEAEELVLNIFKETLTKDNPVFGLATGSTPVGLYQKMKDSDLDFSNATSINLDEYVGLTKENDQSYHFFMNHNLFNDCKFKQNYLPDGSATDLFKECARYDQIIADNPIDVQILGIGENAHIGFNEPGTSFESTTHIVDLQQSTIEANSRFFDSIDDVPKQAVSMGISSIMSAKKIVLLAFGEKKAKAIFDTVKGEITEDVPASILQKHDDVLILIDKEAGKLL